MLGIRAIRFALIKPYKYIHHSCIMFSADNTTVVSYINKQGGTDKFNVLADTLPTIDKQSKQSGNWIDWYRIQFQNVLTFQFGSVCDTFQSQSSTYVFPVLDNQVFAIDAILFTIWNNIHAYAFPTTILIPSVLNKIHQSQCRMILITPLWP